jgi:arsenate reductase (glutaredoxin)
MTLKSYNVLFLCTGNSARSIMAECALNRWGHGRFHAYSAGSQPKGQVHPMTLRLLKDLHYDTSSLRSKSWDEFARPGAPPLDFVFTICDNAAAEVCPIWPGQPMTAHWGVEDPAAYVADDAHIYRFFKRVHGYLEARIKIFMSLPIARLDRLSLQHRLDTIGHTGPDGAPGYRIYHNPACGTSRNVLALIRNSGVEPEIVEYLKTPPTRPELIELLRAMGTPVRALLREKGTPFHELGLDDRGLADDQLLDAMLAHPILINRPIVVTPLGVRLCRPSETVLDILPGPQRGSFAKEDGERVVDAAGARILNAG